MTEEAMSPLQRRMIEDMAIRKLAPKTQQDLPPDYRRAQEIS
jgi:integrase/recombinase XerD